MFLQLANGYLSRGNREDSLRNLRLAHHLFPTRTTQRLIASLTEG